MGHLLKNNGKTKKYKSEFVLPICDANCHQIRRDVYLQCLKKKFCAPDKNEPDGICRDIRQYKEQFANM